MAEIKEGRVKDLEPDDKNFNQHTDKGKAMLRKSIEQFGYGRSILVDKNDRIIGGNGVQEVSDDAKTIIVETTGDELVVVKRTDIDLDSKKGREMALADNATAQADLKWDKGILMGEAAKWGIDIEEWGIEMAKKKDEAGRVPFTEVLGEEHNYVVLFCDNDVDWLQMQSIFDIGKAREFSTARGKENVCSKKIGVGRIIKWQDAWNKLQQYENLG